MLNSTRRELRHKLLHIRYSLSSSLQRAVAKKITTQICSSSLFLRSQSIACYLPIKGEINVWPLIWKMEQLQKSCYLPLVSNCKHRCLEFILYKKGEKLVRLKNGVLQPEFDEKKIIATEKLDLVIVPLVGFDIAGNRLGQGGGYYDRTFAFKLNDKAQKIKPYLLGVAYEWQKVASLPTSEWDVKLDGLVTEETWYTF